MDVITEGFNCLQLRVALSSVLPNELQIVHVKYELYFHLRYGLFVFCV
jgi:hypothetical protein